MNETNRIDEAKLKNAIEMMKQVLGEKETARIEKIFEDRSGIKAELSEKELKTVKTVIENPEMLKTILSSRKAREILTSYLNKM